MGFSHVELPAVSKRVLRMGIATNYGLKTADAFWAAERGANLWLWTPRYRAATPVIRAMAARDRQRQVVVMLGMAYTGGMVRRGVESALRELGLDHLDVYLLAWLGFSVAATGLQWSLERLALLSPAMASASLPFGGAVLIAAGIYQLTPFKRACLRHCRSPIQSLTRHWRTGSAGALVMGLEHGAFCLGCCWALMGLLFFGGVMNLFWIAGLAAFVFIEKAVPAGHWIGSLAGGGLIVWGGVLLAASLA